MPRDWRRLGQKLRDRRTALGLTQQTIADRVGVARNTVARVEIGNRRPSIDLLDRLSRALKIPLADLLD